MQEKYKTYLKESARHLQIADHMTYITFQIVNEKKLLLKIFEEISKSINGSIHSAIYSEFVKKRIILNSDDEKNILNFFENISESYGITKEELEKIKEVIRIEKKYQESAIEFVKKEKVIMMSDSLNIHALTIEDIKDYLSLAKNIFLKISSRINSS
jgi:hypothetical protein